MVVIPMVDHLREPGKWLYRFSVDDGPKTEIFLYVLD